ncbi:integration host factor subunit alpha [Amphibiibacter pelophylacis]|uniref:Integration host factor subunit alpha n=1 Tax=Amphibiibacter pelophylacis TaxID=1799477 RepID=A0ACC6P3G8_9BURK
MNPPLPSLSMDLETATLTKAELADLLYTQIGLNKRESKDMVEAFFDVLGTSLEQHREVKISGFGHFQVRQKSARPGRNPRTGELVPIEARQVVTFHPSAKLKALVQGQVEQDD